MSPTSIVMTTNVIWNFVGSASKGNKKKSKYKIEIPRMASKIAKYNKSRLETQNKNKRDATIVEIEFNNEENG